MALAAFLLVATGVVWRRAVGYGKALEMRQLEARVKELEAERAKLVNDVRSSMSIGRLGPVAGARLGLHVASDSQVIRLPMPIARRRD